MYREVLRWNKALDPVDFVERGEEPRLEHASVPQIQSSFRPSNLRKIQAQQRKDQGKDAYIMVTGGAGFIGSHVADDFSVGATRLSFFDD